MRLHGRGRPAVLQGAAAASAGHGRRCWPPGSAQCRTASTMPGGPTLAPTRPHGPWTRAPACAAPDAHGASAGGALACSRRGAAAITRRRPPLEARPPLLSLCSLSHRLSPLQDHTSPWASAARERAALVCATPSRTRCAAAAAGARSTSRRAPAPRAATPLPRSGSVSVEGERGQQQQGLEGPAGAWSMRPAGAGGWPAGWRPGGAVCSVRLRPPSAACTAQLRGVARAAGATSSRGSSGLQLGVCGLRSMRQAGVQRGGELASGTAEQHGGRCTAVARLRPRHIQQPGSLHGARAAAAERAWPMC